MNQGAAHDCGFKASAFDEFVPPFQPTGAPPVEHRTSSEGGCRQQAGQADALQVRDEIDCRIS